MLGGVRTLFDSVGPALAPVCRVMVSALESLFSHPDVELRAVSVVVAASLTRANAALFEPREASQVLWGALLQGHGPALQLESRGLGSGSGSGTSTGGERAGLGALQRQAVLVAAQQLARATAREDRQLAQHLLAGALSAQPGSEAERAALRAALLALASESGGDPGAPGAPGPAAPSGAQGESLAVEMCSTTLAALAAGGAAHGELHHGVAALARVAGAASKGSQGHAPVLALLRGLERYLQSPVPTWRYGALLCAHAVMDNYPAEPLAMLATPLFTLLVHGVTDPCQACALLSAACLRIALRGELARVRQGGPAVRRQGSSVGAKEQAPDRAALAAIVADVDAFERCVLTSRLEASSERSSAPAPAPAPAPALGLAQRIVRRAQLLCGAPPDELVLRLASGLQALPRDEAEHRLGALLLWAPRVAAKTVPTLVHNVLMGLRTSGAPRPAGDAAITDVPVRVIRALAPALTRALRERKPEVSLRELPAFRAVCALETVLLQMLEAPVGDGADPTASAAAAGGAAAGAATLRASRVAAAAALDDERSAAVVETLSELPLEHFEEGRLERLQLFLLARCHAGDMGAGAGCVRREIYRFFGAGLRLWRTAKLRLNAISALLCCVGDSAPTAAQACAAGLVQALKDAQLDTPADFVTRLAPSLQSAEPAERVAALDALVTKVLAAPELAKVRATFFSERFLLAVTARYGFGLASEAQTAAASEGVLASAPPRVRPAQQPPTPEQAQQQQLVQALLPARRSPSAAAHLARSLPPIFLALAQAKLPSALAASALRALEEQAVGSTAAAMLIPVPGSVAAAERAAKEWAARVLAELSTELWTGAGVGARALAHACLAPGGSSNGVVLRWLVHHAFNVLREPESRLGAQACATVLAICTALVPLGLGGLNKTLLLYLAPLALDKVGRDDVHPVVRARAVELLVALALARPRGCRRLLRQFRDALRSCLASHEPDLARVAAEALPLATRLATDADDAAAEWLDYLCADVAPVYEEGAWRTPGVPNSIGSSSTTISDSSSNNISSSNRSEAAAIGRALNESGDPLVGRLGPLQLRQVVRASLRSLGEVQHVSLVPMAVDALLELLHCDDDAFRLEALTATLAASTRLRPRQRAAVCWVVLPLAADPSAYVRAVLERAVQGRPLDAVSRRGAALGQAPDADDEDEFGIELALSQQRRLTVKNHILSEPLFTEAAALDAHVSPRAVALQARLAAAAFTARPADEGAWAWLVDADAESQAGSPPPGGASSPVRGSAAWSAARPEASLALLDRLRSCAAALCGELELDHVDLIEYHMHQYAHSPGVNGAAALLLSEVARRVVAMGKNAMTGAAIRTLRDGAANGDVVESTWQPQGSDLEEMKLKTRGVLAALYLNVSRSDAAPGAGGGGGGGSGNTALQASASASPGGKSGGPRAPRGAFGLMDRSLVVGSAIGLRNVAGADPGLVVPFLLDAVCHVRSLGIGQLLAVKHVLSAFPAEELRTLVAAAHAQRLTEQLVACIRARDKSAEVRRAALDLVSEVAVLAGPDELASVVRCIIAVLEEDSDATVHAMSQDQLSRVFAHFGAEHPLVGSLIEYVQSGLASSEPNKRQRSFTLLSIVARPMGAAAATPGFARALADPDARIRRMAQKAVLSAPPDFLANSAAFRDGVQALAARLELDRQRQAREAAAAAKLAANPASTAASTAAADPAADADADADDSKQLALDEEGLGGSGGGGGGGGTDASDGLPSQHGAGLAQFPLMDDDPLNVAFLKGDAAYKALLDEYGFTSAVFVRAQLRPTLGDAVARAAGKGAPQQQSDEAARLGVTDDQHALLLKSEPIHLVRLLLQINVGAVVELLDATEQDVETARAALDTTQSRLAALVAAGDDVLDASAGGKQHQHQHHPHQPQPKEPPKKLRFGAADSGVQDLGASELQLEQLVHNFSVHATLLRAVEKHDARCRQIALGLQALVEACARVSQAFRALASTRMSHLAMLQPDAFDLPFVSVSHLDAYERQRNALFGLGSVLGGGGSDDGLTLAGGSDSLVQSREALARRRHKVQQQLFEYNSRLWIVSKLQQTLLGGVGTVFACARGLDRAALVQGFEWLVAQLTTDQHRGLRGAARAAALDVARGSAAGAAGPEFRRCIADVARSMRRRLAANAPDQLASAPEAALLYRSKVDLMTALVQLLPLADAPQLARETAQQLVAFWNDPDGVVRRTAIQLVETLGDSDLPEIRDYLAAEPPTETARAAPTNLADTPQPFSLRHEITRLLNDASYPDKEALGRLLNWASFLKR